MLDPNPAELLSGVCQENFYKEKDRPGLGLGFLIQDTPYNFQPRMSWALIF